MNRFKWLAPCANVLCLIHCIGFGALGLISPLFLVSIPHLHWVDWFIVLVNVFFGFLSLKTMNVSKINFVFVLVLAGAASLSLLFHKETLFHLFIFINAVVQVYALYSHHRKPNKHENCCDHEHDKKH